MRQCYAIRGDIVALVLINVLLCLDTPIVVHASIPVPTHGMIAYMGAFSSGSVVETIANERYYNVVQFAIQVLSSASVCLRPGT